MDILTFLDAVDRTEHHRRLPSSAELTRKVRSAEASLQQEIAACRRRLQSLERMNSEFSNQKRDYTKALMQLQASIDRIIRDKEDLSEQIGALKSELSQLESAKSIDHQPMIQCQIEAAVAQAKSDLNDKLSQTLRRLTEESARKAAMEFAPQLNQLKAKHSSEASVLRTQNATELDRLASQNQRELSRFLSSIRQQFRAQTEQQLELLDRDHANALEQFRRKAERERTRFDADLSRIRKLTDVETAEIRSRHKRELERERANMNRLIEGCQADVRTAKRIAEQQLLRLDAQSQKQELFNTELIGAEFDMIFEKRNKAQIAEKSRQKADELALFEEELQAKSSRVIAENAVQMGHEIELLSNANELARKEIARQRRLLEKEENFRIAQERRHQRTRDELESVTSAVAALRESLLELQAQGTAGVSVPEASAENERLRREIEEIGMGRTAQGRAHERELDGIREAHATAIRETDEKVRGLIERKNRQTKELRDQLAIAKEKIDLLASALHEA